MLLAGAPPPGVDVRFTNRLAVDLAAIRTTAPAVLSQRELAVLSLLPSLLTTSEIAHELTVSVNTVKTHIRSIYGELGVRTRRDAVRRAYEHDLID